LSGNSQKNAIKLYVDHEHNIRENKFYLEIQKNKLTTTTATTTKSTSATAFEKVSNLICCS
jgi:hypothetical protein